MRMQNAEFGDRGAGSQHDEQMAAFMLEDMQKNSSGCGNGHLLP